MPTYRTLKVVPTPPLAAFTGLIVSFILEHPCHISALPRGPSDTTLDCGDMGLLSPDACLQLLYEAFVRFFFIVIIRLESVRSCTSTGRELTVVPFIEGATA